MAMPSPLLAASEGAMEPDPWSQQGTPAFLRPVDPVARALSFTARPSSTGRGATVDRPSPLRAVSVAGSPSLSLANAMETETLAWRAKAMGATPLERTIDAIGMGRYQWALLLLAGTGWATDNMFLQAIALAMPEVQRDFAISDRYIGLMSSSTFAGMMVGALAWGSYSDTYGRKGAFNGTLVLVAVFGSLAAFATSFLTLCLLLFLLGLGLGGSMPTDGTLFLENVPVRKQYLLTALSVFFAAGSVASSALALLIIPGGPGRWRWFLGTLGVVATFFLILRVVFFPLLESPRFLVSTGRSEDARVALQKIAAFNGAPLPVALSDVSDTRERQGASGAPDSPPDDDSDTDDAGPASRPPSRGRDVRGGYSALARGDDTEEDTNPSKPLPGSWQDSLAALRAKYSILLSPEWRRTSILTWSIWGCVTLAYTMFNVFLPKYLEAKLKDHGSDRAAMHTLEDGGSSKAVMQDYLLYSLASLPGSLLGAWAIETRLGRKGTMALSLAGTGVAILAFVAADSSFSIVASSMVISLAVTTAYAAIYGYTPEVFETDVRGTASGTASALSRLAGIVAPVLAGVLFATSLSAPLVVSVILFVVSVGLCLALPIETRGRASASGQGG
ncbi:unnamed protein product [Parajaminaea phylloscopi]